MSKRLNLRDKMEEINERFSHKNKAALANDLLENKLRYQVLNQATFRKKLMYFLSNINKKWGHSKQKHFSF